MHATLNIVSSPVAQEIPGVIEEFLWKHLLMNSSLPKISQLWQSGRDAGSRKKGMLIHLRSILYVKSLFFFSFAYICDLC